MKRIVTICMLLLMVVAANAQEKGFVCTGNNVNVRKGPGLKYPVYDVEFGRKRQLMKGDVVSDCGKRKNGFLLVAGPLDWGGDERDGWVSANELRPNGHDEKSMPSGHTALAFFSAAVLDREFGHYSPWISVGGYSIALATQFHRIHFNHHYLNDVVTGAGIGIVSANLGYFIADKIYGRKGINQPKVTLADANAYLKFVNKPITFALVSSTETGYNKIDEKCYTVEDGLFEGQLRTTAGLSTALEADWFFNENLAAVFSARMAQFKVQPLPDDAPKYSYYGSNIYQYHFNAGIKYSLMSSPSSRMALKAYAGQRLTPETNFLNDKGAQAIHLNKSSDFEFGAGISFDFLSSSKYISGFAVDYTRACTDFMTNRWLISSFWKIML